MSTRVPLVFLLSGFPRLSKSKQGVAYGDGELDIVRNRVICTGWSPSGGAPTTRASCWTWSRPSACAGPSTPCSTCSTSRCRRRTC
jgi:hypothetical protein